MIPDRSNVNVRYRVKTNRPRRLVSNPCEGKVPALSSVAVALTLAPNKRRSSSVKSKGESAFLVVLYADTAANRGLAARDEWGAIPKDQVRMCKIRCVFDYRGNDANNKLRAPQQEEPSPSPSPTADSAFFSAGQEDLAKAQVKDNPPALQTQPATGGDWTERATEVASWTLNSALLPAAKTVYSLISSGAAKATSDAPFKSLLGGDTGWVLAGFCAFVSALLVFEVKSYFYYAPA